jgi:hypothetical protein
VFLTPVKDCLRVTTLYPVCPGMNLGPIRGAFPERGGVGGVTGPCPVAAGGPPGVCCRWRCHYRRPVAAAFGVIDIWAVVGAVGPLLGSLLLNECWGIGVPRERHRDCREGREGGAIWGLFVPSDFLMSDLVRFDRPGVMRSFPELAVRGDRVQFRNQGGWGICRVLSVPLRE